jgi:hypothetical protein
MTFSTSDFNPSSASFKTYCKLSGVLAMSGLTVISLATGACAETLDATDVQPSVVSAIHLDAGVNLPLRDDVRSLVAEAVLPETKAVEPIADFSLEAFPATGHRAISRALRDSAAAWASERSAVAQPSEPVMEELPNSLDGGELVRRDATETTDRLLVGAESSRSLVELVGQGNSLLAADPVAPPVPEAVPAPVETTVPGANSAAAPKKWGVGIRAQASTLGFVGLDAGYRFSDRFHGRLGVDLGGIGYNTTNSGVDYDANLSLSNVHLLGDYFPFGGGLRLTGGLIVQGNRLTGNARANSNGTVNLDGQTYTLGTNGQISNIASEAAFSSGVAPYIGIGFGSPISPGLSFNADLGVMFPGSPTVRLNPTISPTVPQATADQIRQQARAQEDKTNRDISGFSVYPVLSIGFSYAF